MKSKRHIKFEKKFKERLEYYKFNDRAINSILRIFNYVLKKEMEK